MASEITQLKPYALEVPHDAVFMVSLYNESASSVQYMPVSHQDVKFLLQYSAITLNLLHIGIDKVAVVTFLHKHGQISRSRSV